MFIISIELIKEVLKNIQVSIFIYAIMIDIITGVLKAFKSKNLRSCIGLNGLIRHTVILSLVIFLGAISIQLKADTFFNGLVLFYIVQYILSIVENLYILDVPIPKSIYDKLMIFRKENPKHEYIEKL